MEWCAAHQNEYPNEETLEAIAEAKSGGYAGTIDMTNFDSFMNSINEIR